MSKENLVIDKFWFSHERIDCRRDKHYGLKVKFCLSTESLLDYRSVINALKEKYSSPEIAQGQKGYILYGNHVKLVDKPSKIPDSSQVISELGGLDKIKQDFVNAASIGARTMQEFKRREDLAAEARSAFSSYWNAISAEAKSNMDYEARIKNLQEEFKRQAVAVATELFSSLGKNKSGIHNEKGSEMVYEPAALAMARVKILEYAKQTNPDNFFSRGSYELIKPDDFKETEDETK